MDRGQVGIEPVKPEQAIKYWATRRPLTAKEKAALLAGARSRAMTVAGQTRYKNLARIHAALEKALSEGTTFADFKKETAGLFSEDGKLSKWRMENVFRTNLATAYSAGAWAEIQNTRDAFPYLEYSAVGDDRTRPSHAVLDGKIYPVDHEFWDYHYPPNGFACRCTTLPVSRWRAQKYGLAIETEMPGPATYTGPGGYPVHVAAPGADKGFHNNVGRDWLAGLSPTELDEVLSYGPARMLCPLGSNFAAPAGPCGLPLENIEARHILPVEPGDILPAGKSEEFYILEFLKRFGLDDLNATKSFRLPHLNFPLTIGKALFLNKGATALAGRDVFKANKTGRGPYLPLMARTIQNPFEIWRDSAASLNSGKVYQVARFIRLFQDPAAGKNGLIGGFAVFNFFFDDKRFMWRGSTAFAPNAGKSRVAVLRYLEKERRGHLIHREK